MRLNTSSESINYTEQLKMITSCYFVQTDSVLNVQTIGKLQLFQIPIIQKIIIIIIPFF